MAGASHFPIGPRKGELMAKDRWFVPVMAILFGLCGYMSCQSCRIWQASAQGAEFINHGYPQNRVRIIAPDKKAALDAKAITQGYAGVPITIHLKELDENESSLTEFGTESAQLHVWAPRSMWWQIVKVACRMPHECDGTCQRLFQYRRFQ